MTNFNLSHNILELHSVLEQHAIMFKSSLCLTIVLTISCSAKALHNEYADLDGLGEQIRENLERQLEPLQNLGATIQNQVAQNLKPLQNLGANIQNQVYENLKPVREMQSRMKIRFGTDGTTVVTFSPGGKTLVIRNNNLYECSGQISSTTGACSERLQRFEFRNKEDYCYATASSSMNDWLCFLGGRGGRTGIVNGKIFCESINNNPTLLIQKTDYINMCSSVAQTAHYKYFANHKLQDVSNDVQCTDGEPQVCTMTAKVPSFG